MRLLLPILLLASTANAAPVVYLVRHAEKVDESSRARLSPTGHERARRLARMLRDAGITQAYVTEYERTQETAAPLVEAGKLRRLVVPAGKSTTELVAKLKADKAAAALVVSHSNVIPELWKALGCAGSANVGDRDYDQIFVIVPVPSSAPRCLTLHMD